MQVLCLQTAVLLTKIRKLTARTAAARLGGITLSVLFISFMNIPDSISMSDLLSIQQDAEKDPGTDKESLRGTDLYDLAAKLIKQASSKTDRPAVLHKAMAFVVINHMIEWHTKQADAMREEGLDQSATSWMRDLTQVH